MGYSELVLYPCTLSHTHQACPTPLHALSLSHTHWACPTPLRALSLSCPTPLCALSLTHVELFYTPAHSLSLTHLSICSTALRAPLSHTRVCPTPLCSLSLSLSLSLIFIISSLCCSHTTQWGAGGPRVHTKDLYNNNLDPIAIHKQLPRYSYAWKRWRVLQTMFPSFSLSLSLSHRRQERKAKHDEIRRKYGENNNYSENNKLCWEQLLTWKSFYGN